MQQGRRLGVALALLVAVLVFGTVGYVVLGFSLARTRSTRPSRRSRRSGSARSSRCRRTGQVFTMVLILVGVGATLYALAAIVELIVEGRLNELLGRRRMEQSIAAKSGHVIICGWGRVGRAIASDVHAAKRDFVIVETDPDRVAGEPHDVVVGDATDDAILEAAGHRARRRPRRRGRQRRRQLLHRPQRPGASRRPVHRRPRSQPGQPGEAPSGRCRPHREPAEHRRRRAWRRSCSSPTSPSSSTW